MPRPSDPGRTPVSGATVPSAQDLRREHLTPHVRYASQPIIDRSGRVVASELLFRWNASDELVEPALGAYATAAVLSNALLDGELLTRSQAAEHPIGDLLVNVDGATLMGPIVEALTPDIGVIELLETVEVDDAITARIQDLHSRGYRIALDDVVRIDDPRWALAPWVQFVKLDMLGIAPAQSRALVRRAHQLGLAVIAEKIEDTRACERARADGADYFQGFGIAAPMTLAVPALPGCEVRVLGQLYLLACAGVGANSLALVAGRHPAVVARLLRLQEIHAPQFAASSQSLVEVLESLPPVVLTAWLAVLNIAAAHGRDRDLALWLHGELAHGRARLSQTAGIRSSEALERASFLICKQLLRMRLQPRPEGIFRSGGAALAHAGRRVAG